MVYSLPDLRVHSGQEVTFEAKGPAIHIDGQRILATDRGLMLDGAVFAIEFDADGKVSEFHRFRGDTAFENFTLRTRNRLTIGVSTSRTFNHRIVPGDAVGAAFFAGYPSTPSFVAGPLVSEETVALPAVGR